MDYSVHFAERFKRMRDAVGEARSLSLVMTPVDWLRQALNLAKPLAHWQVQIGPKIGLKIFKYGQH